MSASVASVQLSVVRSSEAVLRKHARSFRWAAPFLARSEREDAAVTYAFCREVDDLADEARDADEARRALTDVLEELAGERAPRVLVAAYLEVAARRGIDPTAAGDLVVGVRGDCDEVRVADDAELSRYCYRVAGTVGLMMAGILNARDPRAREHAMHLGMGMQLSNICRDVLEDARLGRVYLPADRLLARGVTTSSLLSLDFDRTAVFAVVSDLLAMAEAYYASAEQGMRYLPPRARLAVYVAARLYRAIGRAILRRGSSALEARVVVPPLEKVAWCLHAGLSFAGVARLGSKTTTLLDATRRRERPSSPAPRRG